MKYGMKNILFSLFVLSLICPVAAQTADTDRPVVDNTIALREIQSSFFSVSTQKTFHLIFPNEVKYFSIGDENVACRYFALLQVAIAQGFHLFPFRTEKLSLVTPMVLRHSGRVGSCRF